VRGDVLPGHGQAGSAVTLSWLGVCQCQGHLAATRRDHQARAVSRGGLHRGGFGRCRQRQGEKRGGETAARPTGGMTDARGEKHAAVGGERGDPAYGPRRAAGGAAPIGGSVGIRRRG